MGRPDTAEIRAALAEIARQRADLDRMEATLLPLVASADDLIPIKVAQATMGLDQWAALKRARRGAGVKLDNRWFFRRDYVEKVAARNVQAKCPNASSVQGAPAGRRSPP
ncbi:hypothetical protein MKK67_06800 [Methylobacterium sp. J-072]|uniref:hypothetical protein n=1 Tax=Methylobacterium sp. J-072 TaxID=2836651 RepID=UPI001FBB71A7|nr:hypothetical protein [Methylobacterium sp. J-072]MCJ2092205.1 hypothetical protein [Methylobacterium sp. J-072]